MSAITVFYDGKCGACRFEINFYKKFKPIIPINWIDITKDPDSLKTIDISYQEAMKTLYVLDQHEKLHDGVDAFCIIWAAITWLSWVPKLVKLPLVYQSCWIVYTTFAYLRFRWYGYDKCEHPND